MVVDRVRLRICVRCSGVYKTWLLDICPLSNNSSSVFLVATTCDQLTAVIWTSVVSNWLHTAGVHLLTPVHQTGTHFLPTSDTIVFLSHLSNDTLKHCSSLPISKRSVFGVLLQRHVI